jgi:plasmid maintenance system antidote protein VapI
VSRAKIIYTKFVSHIRIPEVALRIEKAFGVSMDTLLRMQAWHDSDHNPPRQQPYLISLCFHQGPL